MEHLDPNRPWISHPEDLVSNMDWTRVYIDPFEETSRLHFTRAWTFLFFLRLIVFVLPPFIVLIFGLAGAENPEAAALPPWVFPVIVLVTGFASYVLHRRRLLNAERTTSWAYLVLVPLVVGFVGFSSGVQMGAKEYGVAVRVQQMQDADVDNRQIAIDLDRRDVHKTLAQDVLLRLLRLEMDRGLSGDAAVTNAYAAAGDAEAVDAILKTAGLSLRPGVREKLNTALDKEIKPSWFFSRRSDRFLDATDQKSMNGYDQTVRQKWRNHLPKIDLDETSEREQALQAAAQQAMGMWAIPSFLVMLWSLLWLGRLPSRNQMT